MGSKNSKPSTISRDPYRQAAAAINARYPDGLGRALVAAAIPSRRGKPPEVVFLRQNDEGKYVCDEEYYNHMNELVKSDGEGVWDKRPEGHRGIGNIDVRMKVEEENGDERQHAERREGRARKRRIDRQRRMHLLAMML